MILAWVEPLLLVFLPFSLPLLLVGGIWLWLRRRAARVGSTRVTCPLSRRVEALQLFVTIVVVFVYLTTNESKGGLLLMLGELRVQFAVVYLVLAVLVLLALLLSVWIAYQGYTGGAAYLAFALLYVYGFVLNGPLDLMRRLVRLF